MAVLDVSFEDLADHLGSLDQMTLERLAMRLPDRDRETVAQALWPDVAYTMSELEEMEAERNEAKAEADDLEEELADLKDSISKAEDQFPGLAEVVYG